MPDQEINQINNTARDAGDERTVRSIAAVKERLASFSDAAVLGNELYLAYCESSGWKNFRGEPCPPWDDLTDAVRAHWGAVASYVLRKFRHD